MKELGKFLNSWEYHRPQTIDLLKAASVEDLSFSPGQGMGSLAKQFRHLANVQHCYIEAVRLGKIDFNKKIYGNEFDEKERLLNILQDEDHAMINFLKGLSKEDWERTVDWQAEHTPTVEEHMMWLIDHEVMHHGQLIVYWRLLGKTFPASWRNWGL